MAWNKDEKSIFSKKITMKIRKLSELKKLENNPRTISSEDMDRLVSSINKFWVIEARPLILSNRTGELVIIWGNMRYEACKKLGIKDVPTELIENLSEEDEKEIIIRDNVCNGDWNMEVLESEWDSEDLKDWGVDIPFTDEDPEVEEDDFEVDEWIKTDIVLWDLFEIWEHRLLCGDSTNIDDVNKLMWWEKADVWHNDPPYWMKKEKDWVINDNLNYDDLLQFNTEWISLQFLYLKDNWSFYCWGIDEPLMDIYSNILKPYIKTQKATFRNLITWDKWFWQGQNSENTRSYAIADEKCLFVMCGVQGFNNNADNYFEGWDSIKNYLRSELEKSKLTQVKINNITWNSTMANHWFNFSQWTFITEENYKKLQTYCQQNNIDAFKKEYDELKKEYDELKKEYDELKKEYYSTRAYFNNTHDNFNNVWHFERTGNAEKQLTWNHATPKPLALCERVIKSSCPDWWLIIDFFLWSWSTMVASHQLNRKCYWIELDPKYCQTIVNRMIKLDSTLIIKRNWVPYEKLDIITN